MSWANQARSAMAEGRLRLYGQRIDALSPSAARGPQYEVLVRLIDVAGNLCQPAKFLGAVERFGQAPAIDVAVLKMTLDMLAEHPRHLQTLDLCHINVSGQSAASVQFRDHVHALLDASEVPASKLCFELTETASMAVMGEAVAFIESVRARGCKVALDDFGSGLSSFAYLKALPVDILKIDGMFVRDIATDPLDLAVVKAVTDVARAVGKVTIAEWAETPDVLQRLREIGVDRAQGYAVHEPCPLEDLMRD
jgi:EAL domain-containing protein (putative c-di-GMP-specific phosphodiesterase class I)